MPQPVRPNPVRDTLVHLNGLTKTYEEGGRARVVLDAVELEIERGEFLVILGKSGSGKSTLLNLVSGIDKPDPGSPARIIIDGTDIAALDERQQTLFRRDHIGIVFQFFNLIPTLTVLENITLPYELRGKSRRESESLARALLARVGLADRADAFPDKLSGGEQQRVAIARALVHEPLLVLADEPTGNLDSKVGREIMNLLLNLNKELGTTLIIVTHDPNIAAQTQRVIRLRDGELDPENNETIVRKK